MAKKKKVTPLDEAAGSADKLVSLWMEFRKSLRRAFSNSEIPSAEEMRFLEVKSELSQTQRYLAPRLPAGLKYGGKDITELMMQSVSIYNVRELPGSDKKQLYDQWHKCYIQLQRLLGVIDVMREGHSVQFKVEKKGSSGNVKESLGMSRAKKKNTKKKVIIGVAVAIGFAVGFYLTTQ